MQLTELAASIGTLTQLQSLNLFPNQLTELPLEIWQLVNLNQLGLRDNYLTKLPPEISNLTNLSVLDLRNNNLTELPPEIGKLTNLIQLGLRDNNLTKLPPEIGYLSSLITLDLRNNDLTELPPEIGKLTKITTLILYDNHLTNLPPEIGQLTKLTELDFGRGIRAAFSGLGNKLTKLPPEIGQLTNLTILSFSDNQLTELPSEIGQLNSLTELNLCNNNLDELPPEIGRLNSLTKLNLSNNVSSKREADTRYPDSLHRIFLALMGRFDLSYLVADPSPNSDSDPQSLIAQLVPDNRPENIEGAWLATPSTGDIQQTQICRIVDAQNGQSATAEGLFYQLIVRLHKYSLGRVDYNDSVHWQRGLVLDNAYNGRAFLEHKGNDVHITVRAPYPERFLAMLTEEVKYLVESFWEGLRCDVTVPCLNPKPCLGLFEVEKLIENKKQGRPEQPCSTCNYWQSIDSLLLNAPAATQPISIEVLERQFASVKNQLDEVNNNTRRILSQVDKSYTDLLHVLTDEAKEGPRLFSLFPLDRSNFNPKEWIRAQFRLVLWCEHSRLPLPALNGTDSKMGVYELDLDREWFKKASPYLKFLSGTLGMVLPVASSAIKLALDDTAYKLIEEQLDFGKSVIDATIGETIKIGEFIGDIDLTTLERGIATRAENATLRELHALLKAKDPGFGGLVRVMNKRNEFLWVHEKFAGEY